MAESNRIFQFSGGREMVNGTKAEVKFIYPWYCKSVNFTLNFFCNLLFNQGLISEASEKDPQTIRLSNKSFDAEAAQKIAEKLKLFKNVSVVDISDIIAGRPEDEALKVLDIICSR